MIEFLQGISTGIYIGLAFLAVIGLLSQMSLYAKAGQPAISALVPVWNVVVFIKVVGRPAKHALFLIIPGLIMLGAAIAFWPSLDALFPHHDPDAGWIAGPGSLKDAMVPLAIMGVAALPLLFFMIIMFIEVCDSFGKHSTVDKILCVIFNGIYILIVLGVSPTPYESAWWSRKRGKPYYMPDFNHKGKKYLITPTEPIQDDYKNQKLKVKSISKDWDPLGGKNLKETEESDEVIIAGDMKVSMLAADLKGSTDGDSNEVKKSWQEEMKEKFKKD
ncbi:DUF5684 domain-containing protein [Paracrocinitomix mangrovi]|uniref:DUF5684 domain-containing protein n=1 Tax=Paracrocinitomix mangrovi TaxID=2862509 RepID=UPI001C8EA224|nr:DUF5684 domain-containing protein [Paracrocinitomix mangrovi]UKN03245.1 DUF5684 domain-containing protein [Paracrocinitomix mangrovi]